MYTFVLVIHVIVSILLMVVILLQDGKGGDVVSALGGGSQTVFGSTGATSFLTKATVVLTVIFAVTSLSLAVLKTRERKSILQSVNPKTSVEQTLNEKSKKKENGLSAETVKKEVKKAEENQSSQEAKKEEKKDDSKVNEQKAAKDNSQAKEKDTNKKESEKPKK